jgi:hypothetical protein
VRHRVRRVDPLQAAKVAGVLYGIIGLILAPIIAFVSKASPVPGFGIGFAIAMPFVYAAFGAVFVAIGAACYNVVAGWTGGLELDLETTPGA